MSRNGNHKINPRRRPSSPEAREARAREQAIEAAWAIFFTVLRDKEGYSVESLQRVWKGVESLSDSISEGYVNVKELAGVLKDEADIDLR